MKKKYIVLTCALVLCVAIPLVALGLGSLLNTISIHGTIVPGASMTPIVLDLGNMTENSTGGSGPSQNGSPINANATLILPQVSNVTVAFANVSDLSPYTAFQVQLGLYQNGSPIEWGTISQSTTAFTILSVPSGTYQVWIGWTYTAGPTPANVTMTVTVSI
jgi:hypothetical protein